MVFAPRNVSARKFQQAFLFLLAPGAVSCDIYGVAHRCLYAPVRLWPARHDMVNITYGMVKLMYGRIFS